jgi:hypothetical protein
MMRLTFLMYSLIGPSLAGAGVIAVLVAGLANAQAIVTAAAVGAVLGLPLAWRVAAQLYTRGS